MADSIKTIHSRPSFFALDLRELVAYRGLVWLFVKKNFATRYKQTILGSAWIIINPVCTVCMNIILFGVIAGLSTDGIPRPLFYFLNNILWAFFSGCLNNAANTFCDNANLFGKVYFPRMVMPLSCAITQFFDFLIKFVLLLVLIVLYALFASYHPYRGGVQILYLPLCLLQFALLGIAVGIIIASVTVKYKDLKVLLGFGMTIWMYLTPVVYSVSDVPSRWHMVYACNPVYPGFCIFKYVVFGVGAVPYRQWAFSWGVTFVLLLFGMMVFNTSERTFLDSI